MSINEGIRIPINKGYYDAIDLKQNVHETPRPKGSVTQFTSETDAQDTENDVGGGQSLIIKHEIGNGTTQFVKGFFNTIVNKTFIHEGYIQFKDAQWDSIDVIIIPKVTVIDVGGTGYRHFQNYLLVPEALGIGYGPEVGIASGYVENLVEVTRDQPEHESRIGWFDATYDNESHAFSNIIPNLQGKGQFNIFTYEVNLFTFVSNFIINGTTSGPYLLKSQDVERLGHNLGLKFIAYTNDTDHNWSLSMMVNFYRELLQ